MGLDYFGENLKTREYLHNEILNSSVVLNGYLDVSTYFDIVKGDALCLINNMKGFGSREAYDKFVGNVEESNIPLEELTKKTIENNPKFEIIVNKLLKNDVTYIDFQIMIEMYIKRNMELNSRTETISKLLAKGFCSTASKFVHIIGNVLTNEEVEFLADIDSRILFNIAVAKRLVKEKNKLKKREEYLKKIEENKLKKNEKLKNKSESDNSLSSEQHCVAINDQVRNLTNLVSERKKSFINLTPEERLYQFDVVDFLMSNRYGFKTLKKIIKEKISFCEKDTTHKFYGTKLEQTLNFVKLAESYSFDKAINQTFSYLINGKIREVTSEEIKTAENYLRNNNVAINHYTISTVLRRMIIGGDINSKFDKNCLQVKRSFEGKEDFPIQ